MQEVRIRKDELIKIVTQNRAEHRDIFLEAQKAYREKAIQVLDKQLQAAREGRPFVLSEIVQLITPEDHTEEYDSALHMLELEVEDVITLNIASFRNLVEDNWGWSHGWAISSAAYTASPKVHSKLK